jgi:tetratricopeptide (TPR) repeat protein
MEKALKKGKHIIIILSPDYLNSRSTQSRWTTIFRRDIAGKQAILLPILVRECGDELKKPLESLVYIDLVETNELTARERLLAGVRFERSKPTTRPTFPFTKKLATDGGTSSISNKPSPSFTLTVDPDTVFIQHIVSQVETALSKRYPSIVDPNTALAQQMVSQIEVAYTHRDWPDIIRKTEYLARQTPESVPSKIYQMQGRAFREQGEMRLARQAFDKALVLASDQDQRLLLLDDCIAVLALMHQWSEMLRYTKEALQLAPNEPKWLALQQQAQAQLRRSEETIGADNNILKRNNIIALSLTEMEEQLDKSEQPTIALPLPTSQYTSLSYRDPSIKPNLTGGTQMSIELDALQVSEFLRSLRKEIINHQEFRQVYGDTGSIGQEIMDLAAALTTNYQRLSEARRKLALYPGRRQYQDEVDTYLQGLSATNDAIEMIWLQFRANTLRRTESLIIQIEEETP